MQSWARGMIERHAAGAQAGEGVAAEPVAEDDGLLLGFVGVVDQLLKRRAKFVRVAVEAAAQEGEVDDRFRLRRAGAGLPEEDFADEGFDAHGLSFLQPDRLVSVKGRPSRTPRTLARCGHMRGRYCTRLGRAAGRLFLHAPSSGLPRTGDGDANLIYIYVHTCTEGAQETVPPFFDYSPRRASMGSMEAARMAG